MKTFLATAAALLLAPALAHAVPQSNVETVSGLVHLNHVMCFAAPCPPITELVDENGKAMHVSGDMARDLGAFDGAKVTVKGTVKDGSITPIAFAPGSHENFITGTVKDVTNCPSNARCMPKVAIVMNGVEYKIADDKLSHDLISIRGATVTLRGKADSAHVFTQNQGTNVLVRGNLRELEHALNGETHMMMFDDGSTMMISGKPSWSDRNYADVWISGKFGEDAISHTSLFLGSKASDAMYVMPAIEPMPMSVATGSNAPRAASTNAASQQAVSSRSGGSGVRR